MDLSEENEFNDYPLSSSPLARKLDLIIMQVVINAAPSHFQFHPTDRLRSLFKAKLWRMGRALSHQNSRQRQLLIGRWNKSNWVVDIPAETHSVELSHEVETLKEVTKTLQDDAVRLKSINQSLQEQLGNSQQTQVVLQQQLQLYKSKLHEELQKQLETPAVMPSRKRKSWDEYSERHKKRKIQDLKERAVNILSDDQFEVSRIEVRNRDNGKSEQVLIDEHGHSNKENAPGHFSTTCSSEKLHQVLYTKEKYGISDQAYHDLSMVSESLPRSCKIKQRRSEITSNWEVCKTPGDVIGAQLSFKERLTDRIRILEQKAPSDASFRHTSIIKVKLTGDGTYIGSRQHIVTFGFTILDEGNDAKSFVGNHTVCIVRGNEDYNSLSICLRDIINELEDIEKSGIKINQNQYSINFYLGGDWKFLAMSCGIDAANCTHSCIWCRCPKEDYSRFDKEWSITDKSKGARTIQSIIDASKLSAKSKMKYNCSHIPLFPMVPIHRVIIDNLHLFLRVVDNLINLLIMDLRRLDGIEKCSKLDRSKATNVCKYEDFLLHSCKIPFHFYTCKDTRSLKWRDLTGPEKYRLFSKINLPELFPNLPNVSVIQEIWMQFAALNKIICSDRVCSEQAAAFAVASKTWLQLYLTVYQTKHVTPYIHALVAHLHEFFEIYGTVVPFTQQGLEKLNNVYTQFYFRSTNHHEYESLKQLLLKQIRLESLADMGYQRKKQIQTCSVCKQPGHNKRKCSAHNK